MNPSQSNSRKSGERTLQPSGDDFLHNLGCQAPPCSRSFLYKLVFAIFQLHQANFEPPTSVRPTSYTCGQHFHPVALRTTEDVRKSTSQEFWAKVLNRSTYRGCWLLQLYCWEKSLSLSLSLPPLVGNIIHTTFVKNDAHRT